MIKAAIFDIDDTLYDCASAHKRAWRALTDYACGALGLTPEGFEELNARAARLQRERCGGGAAIHDRLIRYQILLELLGRRIDLAPAMERVYWSMLLGAMAPLPGTAETLDRLRERGLAVGIGTNMTANYQFEKLARLDLLRRIDFLVTSEEAGAEKPAARLFLLCAEKAGCAPSECAFVGDSLAGDALGARDAGLKAVWLCRGDGPRAAVPGVAAIQKLPELLDIIPSLYSKGVETP